MDSDQRNVGAAAVLSLKVVENGDTGSNPSSDFHQLCNDSGPQNAWWSSVSMGKMDIIKQLPLMFVVRS